METAPKYSSTCISIVKIITTVLFIVLPFLGFFLGMNYQTSVNDIESSQMPLVPLPKSSLTKKATPTIAIDETANWKTFTSSDNVFTFKYPADGDWKAYENDGSLGKFVDTGCEKCSFSTIDIFQVVPVIYKSTNEYITKSTIYTDFVKTTLNGKEAVKAVVPGGPQAGGSTIEIFMVNNNQGYIISQRFRGLMDKTKLVDFPESNPNILSTFKFLDQNTPTPQI